MCPSKKAKNNLVGHRNEMWGLVCGTPLIKTKRQEATNRGGADDMVIETDGEQHKWERASIITDLILKILAILVIPLFIWGVRLSNQVTAQQVQLANLQQTLNYRFEGCSRDIQQSKSDLAQTARISTSNSRDLIRLQVHMETANKSLVEIKGLLQGLRGGK